MVQAGLGKKLDPISKITTANIHTGCAIHVVEYLLSKLKPQVQSPLLQKKVQKLMRVNKDLYVLYVYMFIALKLCTI
jgi:hypothetical protein